MQDSGMWGSLGDQTLLWLLPKSPPSCAVLKFGQHEKGKDEGEPLKVRSL